MALLRKCLLEVRLRSGATMPWIEASNDDLRVIDASADAGDRRSDGATAGDGLPESTLSKRLAIPGQNQANRSHHAT